MPRPSPEPAPVELLTPAERRAFRVGALFAGPLKWISTIYVTVIMSPFVWLTGGRRLHIEGLENLGEVGPEDTVLMVANHRSFFDYFVIGHVMLKYTASSHRVFFPVRSTFFYESRLGTFVNLTFAGMTMFPPILRDRERRAFNRWSVDRCIYELSVPGTLLGVHPEGKRNKSDNPYALLPAQPGTGRMALESQARVIPFFVLGMGSDLIRETRLNWLEPEGHPISLYVGPELDLRELRAGPSTQEHWQAAAARCMEAVTRLAEAHRHDHKRTAEPTRERSVNP